MSLLVSSISGAFIYGVFFSNLSFVVGRSSLIALLVFIMIISFSLVMFLVHMSKKRKENIFLRVLNIILATGIFFIYTLGVFIINGVTQF